MECGQSPLPVTLLVSDDSNSVTTSFRVWWGPNLKGLVGPMVGQPARYYGTARAVLVGGWVLGLGLAGFDGFPWSGSLAAWQPKIVPRTYGSWELSS